MMGELRGDVVGCERVVLGPRAKVFGNIETRNLTVAEGAYLDGNVSMTRASRREDRGLQRQMIEDSRDAQVATSRRAALPDSPRR